MTRALVTITTFLWIAVEGDAQKPVTITLDPSTDTSEKPPHRLPPWLEIGGQQRGRFESPSGIGYVSGASDGYFANRLRIDVLFKPLPWLRAFAQTQDSRTGAYNSGTQPASLYNPFDLRQAYVDLGPENQKWLFARAGRQELAFGSTRLVGVSDFSNVTRTFDALRGSYSREGVKVDLVAGSVVLIDPSRFDRHKPGEHLYGAYVTLSKIVPGARLEPYIFIKRALQVVSERGVAGDAVVPTLGFRLIGKAPWRVDYSAEFAGQAGDYAGDRISAIAGNYIAGWTVNTSDLKPRISGEFDHASGDRDSRDGTRRTFDQLYASNHAFYGIADLMGWRNMRTYRVGFEINPMKKLNCKADLNDFYLATVQDGLYSGGGARTVLNPNATSRHVGAEIDLQGTWTWSKYLSFGGGIARLFRGEYLRQSVTSNGYLYPYVSWTAEF
jgi:Alginate export